MAYPSLSPRDAQILHSILYGQSRGASIKHQGSTRPIVEKFVDKYVRYFNGDAAEIHSICFEAALDAVVKYNRQPEKEIMAIAVRIMRNRILNASKALSRKKRGSEYQHLSLGVGVRLTEGWEEEGERGGDLYDTSRIGSYGLMVHEQNPLDRAIAIQETERRFGSVERALRKIIRARRRRKLLS